MNLVESLGRDYINQMYAGAWFLHEDNVVYLRRANDYDVLQCYKYDGDGPGKPFDVPADVMKDMDAFAWPQLGYRNWSYHGHNIAVYMEMDRSAKRGFRTDLLHTVSTQMAGLFLDSYTAQKQGIDANQSVLATMAFKPTWRSLPQAIADIRAGNAISVAITPDLAIEINPFSEQDGDLNVFYKDKVIGSIRGDGTLQVPSRIAMKLARAA